MAKHIFLTGPKQIGKSTSIKRFLASHPCVCTGFLTVKSESVYPGAKSVHLLDAGTGFAKESNKKKPSEENFLFFCGKNPEGLYLKYNILPDPAQRFDQIGCAMLDSVSAKKDPSGSVVTPDLILLDEIGPHEDSALLFCASLMSLIDGDIPTLGVLQQTDTSLFRKISSHPSVRLIEVTKKNRDEIPALLDSLFLLPEQPV